MSVHQTLLIADLGLFEFDRAPSFQTPHGGWLSPRSFQLVCPWCGKVWAHSQIGEERWLEPRPVPCESCPPSPESWLLAPPGSLFPPLGCELIDEPMLEALPLELLKREFLLRSKEH